MHITKTTKLKVIELHQEGYSIHKISRELSITRSKASLIINNYAIYGEDSLKRNLKNRKYTAEEKLQIINEYLAGSTMSSLALKYGIPSGIGLISTWVKKYLEFGYNGINVRQGRPRSIMNEEIKPQETQKLTVDEKKRLKALEQENLQLKAEIAYLKKLEALVHSRPDQPKKTK